MRHPSNHKSIETHRQVKLEICLQLICLTVLHVLWRAQQEIHKPYIIVNDILVIVNNVLMTVIN